MAEDFTEKIEGNDLFADYLSELNGLIDKGRRLQPDYGVSYDGDFIRHHPPP